MDVVTATTVAGVAHPGLRGIVLGYSGYTDRGAGPVTFCELPSTVVPIIIELESGWTVTHTRTARAAAVRLDSFVAGVTEGAVLVSHPGSVDCLQVDLTPVGARRLFGLPMSELANISVPIEVALGRFGRDLVQRVGDVPSTGGAPDWAARFAAVDAVLQARLSESEPVDSSVAWSLRRIERSGGRAVVGHLAAELGWSHRRLIARYRDTVGVPPKTVARITRFERLSALVQARPDLDWAVAASDCGYFDQAHMVRDVRELTGQTPTKLWIRA